MSYNWLMAKYNWQQPDWREFQYDLSVCTEQLVLLADKMGYINGQVKHLSTQHKTEALIDHMVVEAISSSAIEGEHISRPDLRSSVKKKLGLGRSSQHIHDKRTIGLAELMWDLHETFAEPLTEKTLFDWHLMLFSSSMKPNMIVGYWRTHSEPMQIVSGYYGRWAVQYEAPPSNIVAEEMEHFIKWFNDTAPGQSHEIKFPAVRAAIAHLYFESIHPFEDGNGRIGRSIAEKALSQSIGRPVLLSLSQAIETDRKAYYAALNESSYSNEVTAWIQYFVSVILTAQVLLEKDIDFILTKSAFFDHYEKKLNQRQLKVVKRMFQEGPSGFKGGMSAKKYMNIAHTSKATATRDLHELVEIDAMLRTGKGRGVRYALNLD